MILLQQAMISLWQAMESIRHYHLSYAITMTTMTSYDITMTTITRYGITHDKL